MQLQDLKAELLHGLSHTGEKHRLSPAHRVRMKSPGPADLGGPSHWQVWYWHTQVEFCPVSGPADGNPSPLRPASDSHSSCSSLLPRFYSEKLQLGSPRINNHHLYFAQHEKRGGRREKHDFPKYLGGGAQLSFSSFQTPSLLAQHPAVTANSEYTALPLLGVLLSRIWPYLQQR